MDAPFFGPSDANDRLSERMHVLSTCTSLSDVRPSVATLAWHTSRCASDTQGLGARRTWWKYLDAALYPCCVPANPEAGGARPATAEKARAKHRAACGSRWSVLNSVFAACEACDGPARDDDSRRSASWMSDAVVPALDCNAREHAANAALLMLHCRRGYRNVMHQVACKRLSSSDVDERCV